MKRIINIICIACVIIAALSACSKEPAPKNAIAHKDLSQEQQDIVDLLSSDKQEILLFDFQMIDAYKGIEFWVEIYENGELVDRPVGFHSYADESKSVNGQLAVLMHHDEALTFTFTLSVDGHRTSIESNPINMHNSSLARGYGPINAPVEIESGKEIVLYTSFYSDNSIALYDDQQQYIENPELLSGYPYVYIIKCKFE